MNLVAKTFHPMAARFKAAKATLKHLLTSSTTVRKFLPKPTGQPPHLAKVVQKLHSLPKMLIREAGKAVANQHC